MECGLCNALSLTTWTEEEEISANSLDVTEELGREHRRKQY